MTQAQTDTERTGGPSPGGGGQRSSALGSLQPLGNGLLHLKEASIIAVTIALFFWFAVQAPLSFTSIDNFHVIAQYVAPAAIIAAGEVMLLISGEIDLSAGSVFAFSPFVMYLLSEAGIPLILAVIGGLLAAALVGLVNGLVTVKFGVASFITTLGMLFLIKGITLTISSGRPVPAPSDGALVQILGGWRWSQMLWALAIIIVMQVVLVGTRFGVHTIATGNNIVGASEAGINTDRIKVISFVFTATFAGFAGILDGIRVSSLYPLQGGELLMFTAVASAVIGGTALRGGTGTVFGALFGAAFLGILKDGINVLGISAYTYNVILGTAIIIAMLLNIGLVRLRGRSGGA